MKQRHTHFIGIKGVAMTALAIVAKEQGNKVTGSDVDEEFPTSEVLKKYGITPLPGFRKENIVGSPDLVVVTGAHGGMNNPEARAAKELGLKVLMHAQALTEFIGGKKCLAVSGNHGKTTTAALLAHILAKNNLDPSFAIGCGQIKSLGAPGHFGKGEYFIAEADEYATDPGQDPTPRFFWLNPEVAAITNIDFDHPDVYKDISQVRQAFLTFSRKIPANGILVADIDNENVRRILSEVKSKVVTYGFSPSADYRIIRVSAVEGKTWFWVSFKNLDLGQFCLSIPGEFNASNALCAGVIANYLGISWDKIRETLLTFEGTKRRFEKVGEKNGIKFFDDYAHHPDQIRQTLQAARAWFPKERIICIFQPHTFSRTKALFTEFSRSFSGADVVIITDIYSSAREKPDPQVSSQALANEIIKYKRNVHYFGKIVDAASFLQKQMIKGDIVVTMGAGDIYKLFDYIDIK